MERPDTALHPPRINRTWRNEDRETYKDSDSEAEDIYIKKLRKYITGFVGFWTYVTHFFIIEYLKSIPIKNKSVFKL